MLWVESMLLSIPLWYLFYLLNACKAFEHIMIFQSHYGTYSTQTENGVFLQCINCFQSHYGTYSTDIENAAEIAKQFFQSHYGTYSTICRSFSLYSDGELSIPLWYLFYPAGICTPPRAPMTFNPTMVLILPRLYLVKRYFKPSFMVGMCCKVRV